MIGKQMSFEAVPENSQRWSAEVTSGCRLLWLPATGNARSPTVDSRVRRMTTTGNGDDWNRRRSGCNRINSVAPGIGK